jgi:hypothetical protein
MPTAKEAGCTPIPREMLPQVTGLLVHVAWVQVGCRWKLERVEGEIAHLHAPVSNKRFRVNVKDLMFTHRHAEKLLGIIPPAVVQAQERIEEISWATQRLIAMGYRIISRRHRMAARVDRPDWKQFMAQQIAPWDPQGEGMAWVEHLGNDAADQYRRVYSRDQITVSATAMHQIPSSCHDPIGYVVEEKRK